MGLGAAAIGVGAAASIGSAAIGAGAAKDASKASAKAAAANNALQEQIYDSNKAELDPYVARGNSAGETINALLGLGGSGSGGTTGGSPAVAASGADPQALVSYLLANSDGKSHQAIQNYVTANQGKIPDADLFAGARALAGVKEGPRVDAYGAANPYHAAVAAVPGQTPAAAGTTAQNALQSYFDLIGLGDTRNVGIEALNKNYAARGMLESGAAQKGILDYTTRLQKGAVGDYFSLLGGQQQTGLAGASALAGVGQNMANAVSANNNSAATASGNAALVGATNTTNALSGLANTAGNLLGSSYASNAVGNAGVTNALNAQMPAINQYLAGF